MPKQQKQIIQRILSLRKQGVRPIDMRVLMIPKYGEEQVQEAFEAFDRYRELLIRRVLGIILTIFGTITTFIAYGFAQDKYIQRNTLFIIMYYGITIITIGITIFGIYWLITYHQKVRLAKQDIYTT